MEFPGQSVLDSGRRLFRLPPRSGRVELLDDVGFDAEELAGNFRDIERVNRLLGGISAILRHLPRLVVNHSGSEPLSVLDLATGSADIPVAISRWAKRRGLPMTITASDYAPDILALARHKVSDHPEITLSQYDARSVPLPDKHFDVVICSLSLHHFSPDDAILVLGEMDRLARCGFILNDLRRSRVGYSAAWIAALLTTHNRLTRHDAPLSVLRAYTPPELDGLLRRAGIVDATISTHPWFRMAAVRELRRPSD